MRNPTWHYVLLISESNNLRIPIFHYSRKDIHLAELGEKQQNGTTKNKIGEDNGEPYNPLEHRNVDHPTS